MLQGIAFYSKANFIQPKNLFLYHQLNKVDLGVFLDQPKYIIHQTLLLAQKLVKYGVKMEDFIRITTMVTVSVGLKFNQFELLFLKLKSFLFQVLNIYWCLVPIKIQHTKTQRLLHREFRLNNT